MDFPKYDGNIHPEEWLKDIQKYHTLWERNYEGFLTTAILLVDSTIELPTGINNIEKLCNALKKDISFTIFKNTNKRKLQLLRYIPEREGGDTSKFISTFRKLCHNSEINDIEEQKKCLYKSLPMNHFGCISNEFHEKMKNANSVNELIKEFEDFVTDESNLIKNGSIVTLKHVATGKYLSSINNLCYTTGSKKQLVSVGSLGPNSLWKITFDKELATYNDNDTYICLQHIKSKGFLGIFNYVNWYCKSPLTEHTEVCCGGSERGWEFHHSKLENHQGYLKSNDTINLSIKRLYDDNGCNIPNGQDEYLRSHDIQFTIGNDSFQEVVCHHERLGGNDEWCIELLDTYSVKLLNWTSDYDN